MATEPPDSRAAEHGAKMIEVKVRFFSDRLADREGRIIPKDGWTRGVVRLKRNETRGIRPGKPIPFNALMEIPAVIEELLIREGITLHTRSKMDKYISKVGPAR